MDELPHDAKQVLALARAAEDPPVAARARVRAAVGLALAAGGAGLASQAANASAQGVGIGAGSLSAFSSKLALVSGAALLIGAGSFAVLRTSSPPPGDVAPAAAPVQQPSVAVAPAIEPIPAREEASSQAQAPSPATGPIVAKARASSGSKKGDDLYTEMKILHAASAALDRGDLADARRLLGEHRADFAHGQLRDERRGLETLARCLSGEPGAEKVAREYMQSTREAVLSARIESACIRRDNP